MANQVPFARILRDSALELLLTCCMLFGVASIVRWVVGPSPISRMLPEIHAELLIVGLAVAILIAGLIVSPPGKETGGHMNPAISFAMWRFGVFPGAGVVPYIIAQLPLGVSFRANGGCDARDMGQRDSPAPPLRTHTQTMRHSPRRQLVVKLKDGCVAIYNGTDG